MALTSLHIQLKEIQLLNRKFEESGDGQIDWEGYKKNKPTEDQSVC